MCFSATASFAASGVLGVTGAATLFHAKKRSEALLVSVPLVFAIQQFAEGVLWLTIGSDLLVKNVATYTFLFFAFIWWPVTVPMTVYWLEKDKFRKRLIGVCIAMGVAVAIMLLYHMISQPVQAEVSCKSIHYFLEDPLPHFNRNLGLVFYLIATVGSCLLSTHRFLVQFGILVLFSFLISIAAFKLTFVSVWCFFAAVLSLFLFFHLRKRPKRKK